MKTFQDGDPLFGVMMNAIANLWPNGTAVLSGCTPTGSGAARQVTVAAGTVVINGTVRSVSQQTKTLDAAAFDRYDLISVDTSGTVIVTKGTEERRVSALPANSVPIAICLVETGQTTLPADRIYDSRMDALRLSVLNIDADKNWNGKNITNAGAISCAKIYPNLILTPAPDETLPTFGLYTLLTLSRTGGSGSTATKTFHRIEGTGRVKIDISASAAISDWHRTNVYNLYKNGTIVWTATRSVGQESSMPGVSESIELDVTSGDAFYLNMSIGSHDVTFTATFRAAVSLALLDGITT